jgi:hypothetical protein
MTYVIAGFGVGILGESRVLRSGCHAHQVLQRDSWDREPRKQSDAFRL